MRSLTGPSLRLLSRSSSSKRLRDSAPSPHHRGVVEVVDVPIEDGRRPAEDVTVELDEVGMPPARIEVDGQPYDLEAVAGATAPWVYRRAVAG